MTQHDGSISTAPAAGTVLDDPTDSGAQCAVCPHPWSAHDRIGVRFCTATRASGATDRGCVCRH